MQPDLRKPTSTSAAHYAGGDAIARGRCVAVSYPVNPGMVNTK
jgi:hypothetical protein